MSNKRDLLTFMGIMLVIIVANLGVFLYWHQSMVSLNNADNILKNAQKIGVISNKITSAQTGDFHTANYNLTLENNHILKQILSILNHSKAET